MHTITTLLYIYHNTINNEAHNTIIYPVCLYNVFFTKNCQKLHILYLSVTYDTIQGYTTLYNVIYKTIQRYIRLYETI